MYSLTAMPRRSPSTSPASWASLVSGRTPILRITRSDVIFRPLCRWMETRPSGVSSKAYDAILQVEPHSLVRQVAVDECRHREVERGHHLVGHLHHIDMQPEAVQVFGHFQTDESAAHDHGMLRSLRIDILFDGIRVGDAAQRENFRALDALDLRAQGLGSGRKHQPVVRLRVGSSPVARLCTETCLRVRSTR